MTNPRPGKDNNFSTLRLLFACLVIFSHSPSILTGDIAQEPRFGSMTFGAIGVDGFFLISGYLITKSFFSSDSLFDYFRKRVARIYPAFLVNAVLCVFVLAPFVGGGGAVFLPSRVVEVFAHFLILVLPHVPGAFATLPLPALNGSAWTIPYEFRCYILVALLGRLGDGPLLHRAVLLGACVCIVLAALNRIHGEATGTAYALFGTPRDTIHLTGVYLAGALFHLYRRRIAYDARVAALSACIFALSAFCPALTEATFVSFGAYVIFWFAMRCPTLPISRLANRTDLSYGVYLYAWPIQSTIAYALNRSIAPLALSFAALALSTIFASFSWILIERPALALAHGVQSARDGATRLRGQATV